MHLIIICWEGCYNFINVKINRLSVLCDNYAIFRIKSYNTHGYKLCLCIPNFYLSLFSVKSNTHTPSLVLIYDTISKYEDYFIGAGLVVIS